MLEYAKYKHILSNKSNDLIITKLFISFGAAIFSVLPSLYLKNLGLSDGYIGILTSIIAFVILLVSGFQTILLEKFNEVKIFLTTFILYSLVLGVIIYFKGLVIFIISLFILLVIDNLRANTFSILFKDSTRKKEFTQKESTLYAISNIGWIIGPFFGGLILDSYGYDFIFATVILFTFSAFFAALFSGIKVKKKNRNYIDSKILVNIKDYFKNRDLVKAYFITFSANFWYVLVFVFMPLFIVNNNLSLSYVGYFIALTQFPLVFIQLRLGSIIKKFGSRFLLSAAFSLLTIIMVILSIFPNVYLVFFLFFLSALAMGFIEPLKEIVFFRYIKISQEEKYTPIYRTSWDTSRILGKFFIGAILLILPFQFVFMLMCVMMFVAAYTAYTIKNFYD